MLETDVHNKLQHPSLGPCCVATAAGFDHPGCISQKFFQCCCFFSFHFRTEEFQSLFLLFSQINVSVISNLEIFLGKDFIKFLQFICSATKEGLVFSNWQCSLTATFFFSFFVCLFGFVLFSTHLSSLTLLKAFKPEQANKQI